MTGGSLLLFFLLLLFLFFLKTHTNYEVNITKNLYAMSTNHDSARCILIIGDCNACSPIKSTVFIIIVLLYDGFNPSTENKTIHVGFHCKLT